MIDMQHKRRYNKTLTKHKKSTWLRKIPNRMEATHSHLLANGLRQELMSKMMMMTTTCLCNLSEHLYSAFQTQYIYMLPLIDCCLLFLVLCQVQYIQ